MATGQTLARGLGAFSLGLGVVQLAAPAQFVQWIGLRPRPERETEARAVGARELMAAAGLLGRPMPVGWMWMRVAGDVMDLALLSREMRSRDVARNRVGAAMRGVVAVTALDLAGSVIATREATRNGHNGSAMTIGQRAHGGTNTTTRVATKAKEKDRVIVKSITVNRPIAEVYGWWHDFANLPLFMRHLDEVRVIDEKRSHWRAKGPAGTTVEWDAETVRDRPNELIEWRSVEGSPVSHAGTVRFEQAPADRGTIVRVEMTYSPPGGPVGVALAKLTGEEPDTQVADDLRHFKQILETGDVVVSEGTVGGRKIRQRPARPVEEAIR
jgi:uncharacterized membrane protein